MAGVDSGRSDNCAAVRDTRMADEKAMAALADYLTAFGGGRHLLSGWRVRIAVRDKASAGQKVNDSYFYNPLGVKFRSKVDVARHLGLVEVSCTKHVGILSADGIDSKLWIGASAAGWAVHSTTDNHNTYTAPDGTRFKRKVEALEWNPPKRVKLKMALVVATPATRAPSGQEAPALAAVEVHGSIYSAAPATTATANTASCTTVHTVSGGRLAPYAKDWFDLNSSEDEAEEDEDEDDDVQPTPESTPPAPAMALTSAQPTPESTPPAPATALSSCGSGTQTMRCILEQLWLGQYTDSFDKLGYDDPDWLATLGQAKLLEVAVEAGMKTGHARKFADLFQRACRSAPGW